MTATSAARTSWQIRARRANDKPAQTYLTIEKQRIKKGQMNTITIRAIATFKIELPENTGRISRTFDAYVTLRNMENVVRASALMRAVMETEHSQNVQYVGIEFTTNSAVVRYVVPSETSDVDVRRHGDVLTDAFYRQCGVLVSDETNFRKKNDIDLSLWVVDIREK
jgi:hypothetical protein